MPNFQAKNYSVVLTGRLVAVERNTNNAVANSL